VGSDGAGRGLRERDRTTVGGRTSNFISPIAECEADGMAVVPGGLTITPRPIHPLLHSPVGGRGHPPARFRAGSRIGRLSEDLSPRATAARATRSPQHRDGFQRGVQRVTDTSRANREVADVTSCGCPRCRRPTATEVASTSRSCGCRTAPRGGAHRWLGCSGLGVTPISPRTGLRVPPCRSGPWLRPASPDPTRSDSRALALHHAALGLGPRRLLPGSRRSEGGRRRFSRFT
jgi:hypothetical protein